MKQHFLHYINYKLHTNNKQMINDKLYWEKYYEHKKEPFLPSLFAHHVLNKYVHKDDFLIELGCGNGRDAVYFAQQGIRILAVDQCENELNFLSRTYPMQNLEFLIHDFADLNMNLKCNHVYSRFSLHSIIKEQQDAVLHWVNNVLIDGGYFHLEVRGKRNEIYMKGKPVQDEHDAFIYENHYRRFLDFTELCATFENAGLKIIEAIETKGFSPFNGTDETFIRIVVQK